MSFNLAYEGKRMGTLAIDGGKPVVDAAEIKPWPILDERDRDAADRRAGPAPDRAA